MYRYYSVLLVLTVFSISASKAEVRRDSIGIENLNGKKLILHRIVSHDTYYSLARKYNVMPKEIMTYNQNKYLQLGIIIKVPTQRDFNEIIGARPITANEPATANNPNVVEVAYTVKQKDNLNRIAQKFGTSVNEIKQLNNLSSFNLHIGQVLKIQAKQGLLSGDDSTTTPATATTPTTVPTTVQPTRAQQTTVQPTTQPVAPTKQIPNERSAAPKTAPKQLPAPQSNTDIDSPLVEHTVASNETIYSIATTYHLTMDQLKAKNKLTTNGLHVGQKLLISGHYPTVNTTQSSSEPLATGDTTLRDPALRGAPSKYGLNQVDEKGTAIWITDPDLDPIKMLVLHRSAPIGTIIKVTNPMTNRSTFAKVVGKFTENESTKDVIIVMTKAVAESIGALDKRFFCNLTYSGQEVEQQ
jgi:peptidoglycan endopeptidase LytF